MTQNLSILFKTIILLSIINIPLIYNVLKTIKASQNGFLVINITTDYPFKKIENTGSRIFRQKEMTPDTVEFVEYHIGKQRESLTKLCSSRQTHVFEGEVSKYAPYVAFCSMTVLTMHKLNWIDLEGMIIVAKIELLLHEIGRISFDYATSFPLDTDVIIAFMLRFGKAPLMMLGHYYSIPILYQHNKKFVYESVIIHNRNSRVLKYDYAGADTSIVFDSFKIDITEKSIDFHMRNCEFIAYSIGFVYKYLSNTIVSMTEYINCESLIVINRCTAQGIFLEIKLNAIHSYELYIITEKEKYHKMAECSLQSSICNITDHELQFFSHASPNFLSFSQVFPSKFNFFFILTLNDDISNEIIDNGYTLFDFDALCVGEMPEMPETPSTTTESTSSESSSSESSSSDSSSSKSTTRVSKKTSTISESTTPLISPFNIVWIVVPVVFLFAVIIASIMITIYFLKYRRTRALVINRHRY